MRVIAAGVRLNEPQIFFAKISKDGESSFDVDGGILKSKIEILFFARKRRKLIDNSFQRLFDDERSHFDVDISAILYKSEALLGKTVQPQNYFPGNGP